MKHFKLLTVATILLFVSIYAPDIIAQTQSAFATGLQAPTKIITAGQSHLMVTETGTATANSGRLSLVDRTTGVRRTLISGLPSAFNTVEQSPSGPSGLKLVGLKLYITIGQGDSVMPGGRGGLVANPHPATPLNNSVLEFRLPADYEFVGQTPGTDQFTLTPSDQNTLDNGGEVMLQDGQGRTMQVRLVADLPDYKTENRPGLPQGNVRPANLFGVDAANGKLYVVDASFNQLYELDPVTGVYSTFAVFPPKPNPLPFGPPFVEAVPTNVRVFGDALLVSFLTGFPFAPGLAEVRKVKLSDRSQSVHKGGLTSAMDVLPIIMPFDQHLFLYVEFSANMLTQPTPPGRLTLATPATDFLASSTLISPTCAARDAETGHIFVTEIFTGRIIRFSSDTFRGAERNNTK